MDRNTITKIKNSDVRGLSIRNGSYFLMRSINGERFNKSLGRTESMSLEEANKVALKTIELVKDLGVKSYRGTLKNGQLIGHNQMLMSDVYQEFYEFVSTVGSKKSNGPFRKESLTNYTNEYNKRWHINGLLDQPIDKIRDEHIEVWMRKIEKIKNKDGLAQVSANFYSLTLLSRFFNWAKDRRYVEVNPCERLVKSSERIHPVKKKSADDERLDIRTDELSRWLFALVHSKPKQNKRNNDTSRDLLLMALMTGSRDTELKHLKWEWFDSLTEFRSYKSPAKVTNEKNYQGTKGKRDYYYACSEIVQAMLKQRYANRDKLATELGGDAPYIYVFPNSIGTGAINNVRKRIRSIKEFAGIKKAISMHSFRFTFANIIDQQSDDGTSFPDRIVQAVIHHKNSTITERYIGDNDTLQIHKCFQHVEDFCSKSMGMAIVYDIFNKVHYHRGVKGISSDNKTIIDERTSDASALRNALYNVTSLKSERFFLTKIIEEEDAKVKKMLGDKYNPDWNKDTVMISNWLVEEQMKKNDVVVSDDNTPENPINIMWKFVYETRGKTAIFRSNRNLRIYIREAKARYDSNNERKTK